MSVKLGIVVVYIVAEDSSKLLEIHLDRIARHATIHCTIYGCAPRLPARDRALLDSRPEVRLADIPPTTSRGAEEHSYYLERLIEIATSDGATHVVTLHIDSFPVRDGWDAELVGRLSERCAFVSLPGINTACLLFSREFHSRYRPTMLLSPAVRAGEEYLRYCEEEKPNLHSGIGYGFLAWKEGLAWHVLRETTAGGMVEGADVYGDMLFHLKGGMRLASAPAATMPRGVRALGRERFESILRRGRAFVPERLRLAVRARFRTLLEPVIDDSRVRWEQQRMVDARSLLFDDPDGYVERLRGPRRDP